MTSMSTPIKRSSKGTKWLVEQTTIMRPIQRQLHLQIAALVSLAQLKDVHIQLKTMMATLFFINRTEYSAECYLTPINCHQSSYSNH